jgi:hypothetical protein
MKYVGYYLYNLSQKLFLVIIVMFCLSCASNRKLYSEVTKKYEIEFYQKKPTKSVKDYDISDFKKYALYHKARAESDRIESATAAICFCHLNDKNNSKLFFKRAVINAGFSEKNIKFLHPNCQLIAKKALEEILEDSSKNLESNKELFELKNLWVLDRKERTSMTVTQYQHEILDSIVFGKYLRLINYYIENYHCLVMLDSIPHISVIYAHNPPNKANLLLPYAYQGYLSNKLSITQIHLIEMQRFFRYPYKIENNRKYFCFDKLVFKKHNIDIPLSSLELDSFIQLYKANQNSNIILTYNNPDLSNSVSKIYDYLNSNGCTLSGKIELIINDINTCKIGFYK